jgi:ribosomal protein S27E
VAEPTDGLKSVEEYERQRLADIRRQDAQRTGVACPICGHELMKPKGSEQFMSFPPRVWVACSNCPHTRVILA